MCHYNFRIRIFVLIVVLFLSVPSVYAKAAYEYYNRGIDYAGQGNFSQAVSEYTKAIEIDSNFADAYYNRGIAYYNQRNLPQAISDFTKVIEINPNYAKAYCNRGVAYDDQGNFSQGISDYTKAIEIDPNLADAYNDRAADYLDQGNFSQAISDSGKAIEINPNYPNAYYNRGIAYFHQKDFTKARKDIHKAESLGAKINPQFLEALKKASDTPGGKAVLTAQESADLVALYRQYFKNMLDGKYEEVWNSTASGSKHTIAREIAKRTNGKATEEQVLNMLNKDENRVRTTYFDAFVKEGIPKKIYEEAVYNVKSAVEDHVWITINLDQEPKDFQILKEDGALKINFFEDLMK